MNNNAFPIDSTKARGPYGENRYELSPSCIFIMTDLYNDYENDLKDGRVNTSQSRISEMHDSRRTINGDNLLHTLARTGEEYWRQAIYVINLTRPERALLYAKNADGMTPFELAFHNGEYAMAYALMLLDHDLERMSRRRVEEEAAASPAYVPYDGDETVLNETVLDETVLDHAGDDTVIDGEEYQYTPGSPVRTPPPTRRTRRQSPPPAPRRGLVPPSIGTVSLAVKRTSKCLEVSKEKESPDTPPPTNKKPKTEKQ